MKPLPNLDTACQPFNDYQGVIIFYPPSLGPVASYSDVAIKKKTYFIVLGPVARSLVSANRWLRGIKIYRFPWYLTLVGANHASSNPGLVAVSLSVQLFA